MRSVVQKLGAILVLFGFGSSMALEIGEQLTTKGNPTNIVKISGEFESGDDLRYLNFILRRGEIPLGTALSDSLGGDLSSAITIGRLFRMAYATVIVGKDCASSCFLAALGSTDRRFLLPVFVHRPYFNRDYYAELPAAQAKRSYQDLLSVYETYLNDMGTPTDLAERLLRKASDETEAIPSDVANELLGGRVPWLDEWLMAKCGKNTADENRDYYKWFEYQQGKRSNHCTAGW